MAVTSEKNVEFQDEKERELFGAAVLGEDVRTFLRSHPVGQYLHHRAKLEIEQAQVDALAVDPDGWRAWLARAKLRKVRQRAKAAKMVIGWLSEAIIDGDRAAAELEGYRR